MFKYTNKLQFINKIELPAIEVYDNDNNIFRVGSSSYDAIHPIKPQTKFRLNEYGCYITTPIYNNPTVNNLGSQLNSLSVTVNSILSSGPINDVQTNQPGNFNIQRVQK